jgi:catechol 2,3-dioxygenase-like lactoylglutathione lyase family enzyme
MTASVNPHEAAPGGGPAVVGIGHMLLRARDLERSVAFYREALGLTIRKHGQARDGGPLVAFDQGLALTAGREAGESPIEHLAFRGERLDALTAHLRGLGVDIVDGPAVTAEYGTSVYVEDPDGNRIEIYGPA